MIKKNIEIKINSKTRQVFFDDNFLGIQGENLQGYLIFKFEDEFVNGTPVVKIEQNGETYNIHEVIKENDTYKMIIKSSLLKSDIIYMALHITENGSETEIPVFISKKFHMYVGDTIETTKTIPDEYVAWIDIANQKIAEIDNLNIDMQDGVVTITRKDGTQYSENVKGDAYVITDEDYNVISERVIDHVAPAIDNNLQEMKDYADATKPTKTSELTNDSNFAVTNQNNNFSTSQTINGTLTINGDIVQNGESYETHAEQIYTEKDEIITRDGAVGGLSANQLTGIRAKKYDGANDGQLGFDANGEARVGDVNDTQPLLTRDEIVNLQEGQVLVWDGNKLRAVGSSDYVKNTDVASITNMGVAKMWVSTNKDGEKGLNISTEV